ncbi:MAG: ABC transporter, permease protein (cluster 3, basic aa/glutamine/opines), partial [uncultured Nocardioides sp.]
ERRSPLRHRRPGDPGPAPDLQHRRGRGTARHDRLPGLPDAGHRSVRVRQVGTVLHAQVHRGHPGRRPPDHPADGVHRHHRRRRLRAALRRRQALRPLVRPLAVLAGRRVLPRRAGHPAHRLLLLRRLRWHGRPVPPDLLGRRDGTDALQRRRARRGVPRRHQRRAQGPGGGGVRHRHAQDAGDDPDPAPPGRQDHDPGDHQPDGRRTEGHQPRVRRRGRGPHAGREADLHAVPEPRADDHRHRNDLRRRQPAADLAGDVGPEALRRREGRPRRRDGRRGEARDGPLLQGRHRRRSRL